MNITGSLADGHCAGDTISVRIDTPLQGNANASYPIYSSDGAIAGRLTVNGDGTAATLTLNDWVSTHRDVRLDAYLAVQVGSTGAGTSTATWTVDGTTYTKPVSPAEAPCTDCDTMPTRVSKWGDYTQNEGPANDTIRVTVQLPTTTAGTTTFTVTDEVDSEGQRFSCAEGDLGWRYYTSLNPDGGVADGASTETGLSRTDTGIISVAQSSCTDTTFTATVTVHGAGIASRLYVPLLVTDEARTEFPDKATVTSDQGFTGDTSTTVYNNRGGGTLGGNDMTPGIEIVKRDAAGNDAESEAEAVDLTGSHGATPLVLTITNTGTERLRDVTVSDALTRGAGTVSNLDCDFSQADPEAPTSGTAWGGPFLIGRSFTCTADLSGVTGEIHEDVASVDATGWFTGRPVRSSNDYHAKVTVPAAPNTPTTTPSGPAPSSAAPSTPAVPSAPATTPASPSPAPHRSTGLPRTGADGASGLAALVLTSLGVTAAVRHRRR